METHVKEDLEIQQKIKSLQGEINNKLASVRDMQNRLEKYYEQLELGDEYNKKKKVIISDHALLRTIERLFYVDLDEIRNTLLPDAVVKRINFIGKGKGTIIHGGIVYVVSDHTVITVYPENEEE